MMEDDLESNSLLAESDIITLHIKSTNDAKVIDIEINKKTDLVSDLKTKISNSFMAQGKNIRLISSGNFCCIYRSKTITNYIHVLFKPILHFF